MRLDVVCAVLLTHRAPFIRQPLPVRTLVSNDVPFHRATVDIYVDVPPFARVEDAIGYHVREAIDRTLETLPWCDVVFLVEEDAVLSPDYFHVVEAALPWMLNGTYPCFTSMNWAGTEFPERWRADRLRVVTGTFPEIVWGVTRALWTRVLRPTWGIRQYDSYLRVMHPELECLAPEITRIRHMFTTSGAHAFDDQEHHRKLAVYEGEPRTPMRISPVPHAPQMRRCRLTRSERGTYRGNLPWCAIVHRPPPRHRRLQPGRRRSTMGPLVWRVASDYGVSCHTVCGGRCVADAVHSFKNMSQLVHLFPANTCRYFGIENGLDLPAVNRDGLCLVDRPARFNCVHHHPLTRRLCPCHEHDL